MPTEKSLDNEVYYHDYKVEKGGGNVEVVPVGGSKIQDAVFGEITDDGPNFRNVGWMGTLVLMLKATIGLGVLGIPYSFQTVGLIPGIILLTFVQIVVTWSDTVVGSIKRNHPEVYAISDVGKVLAGRIGGEVLAFIYVVYMVVACSGGMVAISTAFNAVTVHAVCTAVFIAVAAIIGAILCSIRTLGRITWLGWVGLGSILIAILIVTVAVGVQDRPSDAPPTGPWDKDFKLFAKPSFVDGMATVSTFVYATCNPPTFFGFVSEMRDFRMYKRSMYTCQIFVWVFYVTIGTVAYFYCGRYVAFPALGSAGPLLKRVSYGIALPGLIVTLVLYSHLCSKYIFVRVLRGSKHLTSNTPTHWIAWLSCTGGVTIAAYIIGSAIPVFSSLVTLVGSLLAPFMCMIPFGFMWIKDNYRTAEYRPTSLKLKAAWAMLVTLMGIFLCVAGTYASIVQIIRTSSMNKPFSCADNSNSVPTQ